MSHCDLAFVCDKQLHDLAPTDRVDARHCSDCNKHVFMVSTDEEITVAKVLRRCTAITWGALEVGGPMEYCAPDVQTLHAVGVRLVERITDERIAELRLSFPGLFDGAETESLLRDRALIPLGKFEEGIAVLLDKEFCTAAPELLILGADEEAEQMLASSWYRAKQRSLLDPDE